MINVNLLTALTKYMNSLDKNAVFSLYVQVTLGYPG
jgi:hypothetical protein